MPSGYKKKVGHRGGTVSLPPDFWVVTDARSPDPRRQTLTYETRGVARAASEQVYFAKPVVIWEARITQGGTRFKAVWRSLEAEPPRPVDEHGRTYAPTIRRRHWK